MAFGEDSWLLFRTFVLFVQSDAIADILRFLAYQLNPIQSTLKCASLVRTFHQAGSHNVDELWRVFRGQGGQVKADSAHFETALVLVVVELGLIESQQLEYDHADGEYLRLEDVPLRLVLQFVQVGQLLRRQDHLVDERLFHECLVVCGVLVLFVHLNSIHFHIAFRTEENVVGPVVTKSQSAAFQEHC